MSYTNITINESFSDTTLQLYLKELEMKVKFWEEKAKYWQEKLANIPEALQEYGVVDFYDHRGELIISAQSKQKESDND